MQYTHICKVVDVGTQFEIIIGSVTRAWRRRWTFVHSLYSIEEYWEQLSGTHAEPDSRFVAVTKAYKQLDNAWFDYSPRKAVEVLELAPEDYEVDEERSALLLRRLPPGLPTWAREVL